LRDDTTCIVIDIIPPEKPKSNIESPKTPGKGLGLLKSFFLRKTLSDSLSVADKDNYPEPDLVEEVLRTDVHPFQGGLILNIQSGICSNSLHAQFAKLTWDLVMGYPYTRVCQSPESCVPGMALSFVTVARKRKRQWRGSVTHEIHHQEIVGQVNSIQGQESS